jgi:MFS family permease
VPITRLWLAVLLGYVALGSTIQAVPVVAQGRGLSGAAVGGLVTMAAAATAVSRPIAGRVADRRGPRAVTVAGALLVAAGGWGHVVAPDVVGIAVARLVIGAGEGALFTGALSWVLERAPADRRGRLVGHFGLSMWGGLALGPPLAAGVVSVAGAASALTLAAVAGSSSLVLCLLTGPRVVETGAVSGAPLLPATALGPGATLALASFGYGTLAAFVLLHIGAERLGGASIALATFAAAFLVVRLVGSRLVDDLGPMTVALGSIGLEALALAGIAFAPTTPFLLAALLALGGGVALVYPSVAVWLVERTPSHERGAALGAMTSCWDIGIAVAGPAGGLVVSGGSFAGAFVLAAGACAAGVAALATLRLRRVWRAGAGGMERVGCRT